MHWCFSSVLHDFSRMIPPTINGRTTFDLLVELPHSILTTADSCIPPDFFSDHSRRGCMKNESNNKLSPCIWGPSTGIKITSVGFDKSAQLSNEFFFDRTSH